MSPQGLIPPQVSVDRVTHEVSSLTLEENDFSDVISLMEPERAAHGIVEDLPITLDEHLVEFSEALRTISNALRRVAEGKASAQAEAAAWKHRYEMERDQNLFLMHKAESTKMSHGDATNNMSCIPGIEPLVHDPEESDKCCGKDGICSHEVLEDGARDSSSNMKQRMFARKASFRLAWGCNGDKSGQHKYEVVSFERGNITTAERSSKQILLKWESQPQTVLVLSKPNSSTVHSLCAEMVRLTLEKQIMQS